MKIKSLLYLATFLHFTATTFAQKNDFWNINFDLADSIAFRYHGHDLKHIDRLTDSLTSTLTTEPEKFRSIFRWITDNIAYDYDLYLELTAKESKLPANRKKAGSEMTRFTRKMLRRTIIKKRTICSGYAMLLDYMCEKAGIECVTIGGYARNYDTEIRRPNHAWNAVKLNNKWYLCDVTWASGFVDVDRKRFFKYFSETYFLTDPDLFIANHYPEEKRWTLVSNAPSLREFMKAPLKTTGFIKNKINQYGPREELVRTKVNDTISFKFTANRPIDPIAILKVKRDNEFYSVEVAMKKNEVDEFVINYSFPKKGSYFVYLNINDIDSMVYTVVVR